MSIDENFTLKQLRDLEDLVPGLEFISRILINSYDDFIDQLYKDIDCVISSIQENPELRKNDSEDRLTIEIIQQLKRLGYDATHEEKFGGHTDLLIRRNLEGKECVWIAEAKKHSSYDYLWKGFQQLSTRYSTGDENQNQGGLLGYIFTRNSTKVMKNWQEHLKNKPNINLEFSQCPRKPTAFFSTHPHDRSGLSFRVRHMPVILYFNPRDRADNL
jgi:hypothetical protein